MTDFTTNLLRLKGIEELEVKVLPSEASLLVLEMQFPLTPKYCPICNFRMYSKGVYTRTVKHPILQDGRSLILKLKQRKWKCSSSRCTQFCTDEFSFVGKNRRVTDVVDILIVQAFKDFNLSARQIAKSFHVTDTYALTTFDRYVDMDRLKLPSAVSIDEVKIDTTSKYRYALVLQDFVTGEPIDMVVSRRQEITEPYFAGIPRVERAFVKYIISDMYAPYQNYVNKYFPNAVPIVDSFHVIKLITQKLNAYLVKLKRRFRDRDLRELEEKQKRVNYKLFLKESKELYLLRTKRWIILSNQDSINYSAKAYRDSHFHNAYMYVADYEREMFLMDPHLENLRELKEKYIRFNKRYGGYPDEARPELEKLINEYRNSGYQMFEEVANALSEYKSAIINSFILLERYDRNGVVITSRLSNGPMESLNRVPKDMKRQGRGYSNFDHIRNRFLFAMRKNATILAHPKAIKEVKVHTGRKRGTYKKKQIPKLR